MLEVSRRIGQDFSLKFYKDQIVIIRSVGVCGFGSFFKIYSSSVFFFFSEHQQSVSLKLMVCHSFTVEPHFTDTCLAIHYYPQYSWSCSIHFP